MSATANNPRRAELQFAAIVAAVAVAGLVVAYALGAFETQTDAGGGAYADGTHAVAVIARDGTVVETIDLAAVEEPYTLELDDARGTNVVAVEPGRISVAEADCPDEVCVHTGWIDSPATPIACVPHGLTIAIEREGGDTDDIDAVAR